MSTDTRPFSVSDARPEPARFVTHQDSPLFSTQVEIPQADGIFTNNSGNPDVICESLGDPRCTGGPTPTPAVPEPATWLGGALASGLALWGMRRRFRAGSLG